MTAERDDIAPIMDKRPALSSAFSEIVMPSTLSTRSSVLIRARSAGEPVATMP